MLKSRMLVFALIYSVVAFAGEADVSTPRAGGPLELKLTSHRAFYAVDRGGKTAEEFAALLKKGVAPYGPAVALMVELRNTSDKDLIAFGAPRPQFILKGPRAESVCEVAPTQFQSAPSRRFVLGAGKSAFLNVISFFNPEKDEPSVKDTIKRLSFSKGPALQCVNWTEPGEYTLSAVLELGVSPAPAGATAFDSKLFAFDKVPPEIGLVKLESNSVKLTIREGTEVDYWSEALEDADAEVRFVAAHTLTATLPLSQATRAKMVGRLQDSDARVRKSASRALQRPATAELGDPEVLAHDPAILGLIGALKDANAGVRAFAAASLATWGRSNKASMPALLPLLQDGDANVRLACAEALGEMFHDGNARDQAVASALSAALKDGDERVVNAAIQCLGQMQAPEAVAALMPLCKGANAALSRAAIEAIGHSGGDARAAAAEVEDLLFSALGSDNTRAPAAAALGKIKADAKRLLPALVVALRAEEDVFGRVAIVQALGTCGQPAVAVLQDVLKEEKDSTVKEFAASTLAALNKR